MRSNRIARIDFNNSRGRQQRALRLVATRAELNDRALAESLAERFLGRWDPQQTLLPGGEGRDPVLDEKRARLGDLRLSDFSREINSTVGGLLSQELGRRRRTRGRRRREALQYKPSVRRVSHQHRLFAILGIERNMSKSLLFGNRNEDLAERLHVSPLWCARHVNIANSERLSLTRLEHLFFASD